MQLPIGLLKRDTGVPEQKARTGGSRMRIRTALDVRLVTGLGAVLGLALTFVA
jgi:hypothetical protein